jgi:WD40 repeat protein
MSIAVNSADRTRAVTGQQGKNPAVFVWDTTTGEKIFRTQLNKNSREVSAIAINPEGNHIATADKSNDHVVTVFDTNSGKVLYSEKGGPDHIHDLAFAQDGSSQLWSAGIKHLGYWKYNEGKKNKGLFGSYPRTSFSCICADASGSSYSGGANSLVYKWTGNKCMATYAKHEKGFIGSIHWADGKVYSGGKDGRVVIVDDKSLEPVGGFDFNGILIRAIDTQGDNLCVGLRSGSIVETSMGSGNQSTLHQSHNSGEVWGLDTYNGQVYTTGDDNQVICWDPATRKLAARAIVNTANRKARKNKASTLGEYPES